MREDDWLPIETAPKDGTWFITINANALPAIEVESGFYSPLTFWDYEPAGDGLYRKVEKSSGYDWQGFNNFHRATHWQPIVGPKQKEGE